MNLVLEFPEDFFFRFLLVTKVLCWPV